MKKFRMKKLLALLLTIAMVTIQSAPVFATEGTVSEGQTAVGAEAAVGEEAADPGQTPEEQQPVNEDKPAESEPVQSEEGTVSDNGEGTVSENTEVPAEEVSEPETEPTETVSENTEVPTEEENPESVSEDSASGNIIIEGYLAELTPDQEKNAELLKGEIKKLNELEPEKDYVTNEAVFLADTEEEAKKVAESYGGELEHFALGVATISWKDKTVDTVFGDIVEKVEFLEKASELTADDENGMKPLASLKAADEALYSEVSDIRAEMIPDTLVEPNYIAYINAVNPSDDPLFGTDVSDITKQWFHASIDSAGAWTAGADGTGVTVAVIDTGIDTSNTDLSGDHIKALYSSKNYKTGEDDNGHGTHCAGIVAALDNTVGGLGVAPNAKIISIKAANEEGGLDGADIDEAIQMAINNNVDVISMSFGGPGSSTSTETLLKKATEKGIVCVAAAGNDSSSTKQYPGAYDCTLCVGSYASGGGEDLSSFSNWGGWVDVAAPGSDIYATMPDDSTVYLRKNGHFKAPLTYEKGGCSYGRLNGTSMATPCVAGIAALVKGAHPDYSAEKIKNNIKKSDPDKVYVYVNPDTGGTNVVYGGVNAMAAVKGISMKDGVPPAIEQPVTATLELGVGSAINVAQGKSVDLGAVVLPSTKTKITYKATGDPAIIVTNKGIVKVAKTAAVGATSVISANCGLLSASTKVTVIAEPSTSDFTLAKSHEEDLSVATNFGKNSVEISVVGGDPAATYRFKVSKKTVALFSNQSTTISAKGGEKVTLFAAGNGKATVTAFATDGSGKKATVNIKCVTPITDLKLKYGKVPIEGVLKMAGGGKIKLKPAVKGTSMSKVTGKVNYTWSGPYVKSDGTINPGSEAYGQSFDVTLTAVNNGVTLTKTVKVSVVREKKLKKMGYHNSRYKYYSSITVGTYAKGEEYNIYNMPGIRVNGIALDGPNGYTKTGKSPEGYNYQTNDGYYAVSVSGGKKVKILGYGEYGVKAFRPLKKGTYKVTYSALDGSGKKFYLKIKIR